MTYHRHTSPTRGLLAALWRGLAAVSLLLLSAQPTHAQERSEEADSLRAEVERLTARLDSLSALVARLMVPQQLEDPIARLREAAAEAVRAAADEEESASEPQEFVGRQRSLQALNPEISVTADVFGFVAEDNPGEDNFLAREFEFSFQSALDPYSRAKIFVAHHTPGAGELVAFGEDGQESHDPGEDEAEEAHGGGSETEIEEGYLEWVGLPGGIGLTLGKFRQRLGSYNRWHAHALPGQSYFLPYQVLFGEEGLAQTGASIRWLAPFEGAGTYEGWFEVTRSGNAFFGESRRLSYLAHLNAFWEVSPATYVELGVSGLTGTFEHEEESHTNRLLHVEAGLNWQPPERALYREFNLRGAIMVADRGAGPGAIEQIDSNALGAFVLADAKLGRQWWIGGRFDYVENPMDPTESAWLVAPTVSWWQSEWVRIRAEFDLLDGHTGRTGLFLIQTTISMGPHKHETY